MNNRPVQPPSLSSAPSHALTQLTDLAAVGEELIDLAVQKRHWLLLIPMPTTDSVPQFLEIIAERHYASGTVAQENKMVVTHLVSGEMILIFIGIPAAMVSREQVIEAIAEGSYSKMRPEINTDPGHFTIIANRETFSQVALFVQSAICAGKERRVARECVEAVLAQFCTGRAFDA